MNNEGFDNEIRALFFEQEKTNSETLCPQTHAMSHENAILHMCSGDLANR